ncbi:hypothetical protein EV714DRAFT_269479 [Schizophyllum commune]
MRYTSAIAALILSVLVWRGRRLLYNNILFTPPLPSAYYAHGNATQQCASPRADDVLFHLANDAKSSPANEFKYCEDAVFWDIHPHARQPHSTRRAIISCDAGRKAWNTVMGPLLDPEPKGSLWVMDVAKGAAPVRLEFAGFPSDHDFHPLGLDIYPSHDGEPSNLFVVNHARGRTCIEHFTVSPSGAAIATYIRTLDSLYFNSANSLALTSPTSFLVTNDHLFTRRLPFPLNHLLPITESILSLPLGWVAHVRLEPADDRSDREDAESAAGSPQAIATVDVVAPFIPFPNGVAVSPTRDTVAVASTTTAEVRLYHVAGRSNHVSFIPDLTNYGLELRDTVPLPFLPDNLHFADDGSLVVAGHPNFPKLAALARGGTEPAGSWIVRIARKDVEKPGHDATAPDTVHPRYDIQTLYQSNGAQLQTSSAGLYDVGKGLLIMAGLYAEPGVLMCASAS